MMNINTMGLSFLNKLILRHYIRKEFGNMSTVPNADVAIDVVHNIGWQRYSSLWYGGNIVNISYKGWSFHIDACGDVCADLYRKNDPETTVLSVTDKYNAGRFGRKLRHFFRTDRTLNAALCHRHPRYTLVANNTNWWECVATDPDGRFHDLMWVLDSDHILAGIAEVLCLLDYTIQEYGTDAHDHQAAA